MRRGRSVQHLMQESDQYQLGIGLADRALKEVATTDFENCLLPLLASYVRQMRVFESWVSSFCALGLCEACEPTL